MKLLESGCQIRSGMACCRRSGEAPYNSTKVCSDLFFGVLIFLNVFQNPLDASLNVSRNVTLEEVERFSIAVTRSLLGLQEQRQVGFPRNISAPF